MLTEYKRTEKEEKIKKVFWDYNLSGQELLRILEEKDTGKNILDKKVVQARILGSYNWYTLVRIFGYTKLLRLLSDEMLQRIYPQSVREQLRYARRILSE